MKIINRLFIIIFLLAVILNQGCGLAPENLSDAKKEIVKYYESGKFDAEVNRAADKAVINFKSVNAGANAAVVFDIDETALSSYAYYKKIDFGYIENSWNDWMREGKALPVKGVKRLYDYLESRGFKIIFLTGRKDSVYSSTYKNLIDAGYVKFDTLITRSPSQYELSAKDYKSEERTELTKKGYIISGDIGDQKSDLEGPYHGIQVKIPNYIYIIN